MRENFLPRIGGVFAILSVLANAAAFAVGTSRGLLPPNAFDFGSGPDVLDLGMNYQEHILPLTLSLLSPCLAIPVGLGWFHVLKGARGYALFGVAMFYVGMMFVVILDVLELVLVVGLAPAYALADTATQSALLAFSATLGLAKDVLGYVGHFFSFGLAQIALGLAILRVQGVPKWLGWLAFAPGILLGWVATLLSLGGVVAGPVSALGILSFAVWIVAMAVVLLRWQPTEKLQHRSGQHLR
jgi:hypothetical protein